VGRAKPCEARSRSWSLLRCPLRGQYGASPLKKKETARGRTGELKYTYTSGRGSEGFRRIE